MTFEMFKRTDKCKVTEAAETIALCEQAEKTRTTRIKEFAALGAYLTEHHDKIKSSREVVLATEFGQTHRARLAFLVPDEFAVAAYSSCYLGLPLVTGHFRDDDPGNFPRVIVSSTAQERSHTDVPLSTSKYQWSDDPDPT